MRYIIYGAGAIGGALGALLHQAGRDVVLIARGSHLQVMRERGLTLQMPDGEVHAKVPTASSPREIDMTAQDVVVLAMKGQDTFAALRELAQLAAPGVTVVCAQNGVENERLALRSFADTYGMFVWVPAQHLEPGQVQLFSAPKRGVVDLGRVPSGADERAHAIADDLRAAGFASRAQEAIMRWKYGKLLSNLANAVEALVGPDVAAGEFVREARTEAIACFSAAGIEYTTSEAIAARTEGNEHLRAVHGDARRGGSTWQSLTRGAAIETPYLNGEIVLLGRLHGVPTPVNRALCELTARVAQRQAPPGSLDLEALKGALKLKRKAYDFHREDRG